MIAVFRYNIFHHFESNLVKPNHVRHWTRYGEKQKADLIQNKHWTHNGTLPQILIPMNFYGVVRQNL